MKTNKDWIKIVKTRQSNGKYPVTTIEVTGKFDPDELLETLKDAMIRKDWVKGDFKESYK